MESDPLTPDTRTNKVCLAVRERKGVQPEIPPLSRFLDKL